MPTSVVYMHAGRDVHSSSLYAVVFQRIAMQWRVSRSIRRVSVMLTWQAANIDDECCSVSSTSSRAARRVAKSQDYAEDYSRQSGVKLKVKSA